MVLHRIKRFKGSNLRMMSRIIFMKLAMKILNECHSSTLSCTRYSRRVLSLGDVTFVEDGDELPLARSVA